MHSLPSVTSTPAQQASQLDVWHLFAGLEGGGGVEWADVATQGVPSVVDSVMHCERVCWNDSVGGLVQEALILTGSVPNGSLQVSHAALLTQVCKAA